MDFNSKIILTQKLSSFLICKNDLVKFYEKYNWAILKNNLFKVIDHNFSTNGLIYNQLNLVEDIHKIKKKAEQAACEKAIIMIEKALS